MEISNERLRRQAAEYPFEPMPDPLTAPHDFVQPGQASILYLGGYDHLTQATIVAVVLKHLFEERASMRNRIPPFLAVIEEAHNFIPSKSEGQMETPSVEIIRKVITEGRKFGVGLCLISQRPSRLDETTLSQCNTFLIFRLVNPRDQNFVERVMENLTKADSRLLPAFGPGQGIVSGQAVRFPLVIEVDFDKDLVTPSIGDEDFVKAVADWEESPKAETVRRSDRIAAELDKVK
jgi:DNA helicase HerA-like ATPase